MSSSPASKISAIKGLLSTRLNTLTSIAFTVSAVLAGLVLAFHAAALPYALWQGDEYDYFYNLRTQGTSFFWHRLVTWSPRPLSETLIALYGKAVAYWNRPLIGWALGVIWLSCALLAFGPALYGKTRIKPRFLLVFFTIILIFLGHPIADLHYWPMGAAAHLPVVAAATCLVLTTVIGRDTPAIDVLCLSIAALSSETGLFLSASFLGFRVAEAVLNRQMPRHWAWLLIPMTICFLVAWRLLSGRAHLSIHETPTQGYAWASLRATLAPFLHNLLVLQPNDASSGGPGGGSVFKGILLKGLIVAGAALLCRSAGWKPPRNRLYILLFSLLSVSFLTIGTAYYEFGFLCCQRHETLRLDMTELACVLLGALIARKLPELDSQARQRCFLYACICMVLFTLETARWRYPNMRLFLATQTMEAQARQATWQSGHNPGPGMTMRQGANSPLFYYWLWTPGEYKAGGGDWAAQSMLKFFDKKDLHILPPLAVSSPKHGT